MASPPHFIPLRMRVRLFLPINLSGLARERQYHYIKALSALYIHTQSCISASSDCTSALQHIHHTLLLRGRESKVQNKHSQQRQRVFILILLLSSILHKDRCNLITDLVMCLFICISRAFQRR